MAIDPQQLQQQVDQLAGLVDQPVELERALLALLDRYQVQRRTAARKQTSVPRPVLRSVVRALGKRFRQAPEQAESVLTALWNSGRTEARLLAAQLLGEQPHQQTADLVERWTHGSVPLEMTRQLAAAGLQSWRRTEPEQFLERCDGWLGGRQRLLGLMALQAAVRDERFQNLPRIYRLVEGLPGGLRGRPRQAMLDLMRGLANRSPEETAQFLRDERQQHGSAVERLIDEVLPSLPAEQRKALKDQNGIMPPRTRRR